MEEVSKVLLNYMKNRENMTELKEKYYNLPDKPSTESKSEYEKIEEIVNLIIKWSTSYKLEVLENNGQNKRILEDIEILKKIKNLKTKGQRLEKIENLNKEFVSAIMSNIPEWAIYEDLARAIYIELNKRVKYDDGIVYGNQDLSVNFIKEIYNKNRNEINLENNKITCKNWSELYAELLELNGIKAYILGEKHKYIEFFINNKMIIADGTNIIKDENNKHEIMNDLDRAKYGIKPKGFLSSDNQNFDKIDKVLGYEVNVTKIDDEVKNILSEFSNKEEIYINMTEMKDIVYRVILKLEENNMKYETVGGEKYRYYKSIEKYILKEYKKVIKKITPEIYTKNAKGDYEIVTTIILEGNEYILISSLYGIECINVQELITDFENGKYIKYEKRNIEKQEYEKEN